MENNRKVKKIVKGEVRWGCGEQNNEEKERKEGRGKGEGEGEGEKERESSLHVLRR